MEQLSLELSGARPQRRRRLDPIPEEAIDGLPRPNQGALDLTQADVDRFKDIMRRECGAELTNEEAWSRAIELLAMFRMLLGPLPEDR